MAVKFVLLFFLFAYLERVSGHGMMLFPPNRASLWRIDWTQPANYNDNEFFCGGVEAQYLRNGGKCGPCGDNFEDPIPRSNENTGTYGNGIVIANYTEGDTIAVSVTLTANHWGRFYYGLCVLEDPTQPETEECFQHLQLHDGSDFYEVSATDYIVSNTVQLPKGVHCDRCTLRWHYQTGNSWGECKDGTEGVGCGDQEIFRSCADITIHEDKLSNIIPLV